MALSTITEIDLDINQPGLAIVHAKQYDTVRQVKAHLFYNGVKWLVPSSNYVAVVGFKKADRIGGFYDATEDSRTAITVDSNDRSIIYILLDRNVVTTAGNVNTEITFYDTVTLGRLSTFSFITQVEQATVTELDLTSSPYFNILAEDIKKVIESVDSMTGLSATVSKLAPDTNPTVNVTGGTSQQDPYVFHLGIPSMPGITASATKLAPDATPTATITGGQIAGQDYNINIGIPSMTEITASVQSLPEGASPTVAVTGGETAGQAYNIAFGIPYASSPTVSNITYAYALSTTGTTPPLSGWQPSISDLGGQDALKGKYLWSRAIAHWSSGSDSVNYACAYNGMDASGAVISINGRDGAVNLSMADIFTTVGPI
jgi:hypothetical protein